jgi:hypothetical protein
MSILITKSVCVDCVWKDSCQKLHKLHEMCDSKRIYPGKPTDVFDVVVVTCSLKNFDRTYSKNSIVGMYYCTECNAMHHANSRIGKLHRKDV